MIVLQLVGVVWGNVFLLGVGGLCPAVMMATKCLVLSSLIYTFIYVGIKTSLLALRSALCTDIILNREGIHHRKAREALGSPSNGGLSLHPHRRGWRLRQHSGDSGDSGESGRLCGVKNVGPIQHRLRS